jgi:hypothetical protein
MRVSAMTTATVKIGKLTLRLSPLKGRDLTLAARTARRLAAPGTNFLEGLGEAAGLILIAAQENHRQLRKCHYRKNDFFRRAFVHVGERQPRNAI